MKIQQGLSLEQTVTNKVSEVLRRTIQLHYDADLRNEGLDSLRTIQLIVSLEAEFGIEIDDGDLLVENFSTINKIITCMTEKYDAS